MELFLSSSEESIISFSLFVCSENGAQFLEHCCLWGSEPWILPFLCVCFFFLICCVWCSRSSDACRSESLPHPPKDLTWFQSKAISGTIGTCRSVLPPPRPLSLSHSHSYMAAHLLSLLSCWTGLKRWTAAGDPPDVAVDQKHTMLSVPMRTVSLMLFGNTAHEAAFVIFIVQMYFTAAFVVKQPLYTTVNCSSLRNIT